jgi:hypothetical protein
MKSTRRFLSAALLTIILATAALADDGIIHTDFLPTPTPTPTFDSATGDPQPFGAATTDGSGDVSSTTDTIVGTALSVLGEMLAIY